MNVLDVGEDIATTVTRQGIAIIVEVVIVVTCVAVVIQLARNVALGQFVRCVSLPPFVVK